MTNPVPIPDDLLGRAQAAIEREDVPAGPTAEVVTRTISALAAASEKPLSIIGRRRTMRLSISVAAALLLALGGLVYLGSVTSTSRAVAWAEVAAKMRDAQTLTYRIRVDSPGKKLPVTARLWMKVPNLMRMESSNGVISIINGGPDKQLHLDVPTKSAYLANPLGKGKVTGTFQPGPQVVDKAPKSKGTAVAAPEVTDRQREQREGLVFSGFDRLKKLGDRAGKPIGTKRIGNTDAKGFRIEDDAASYVAWIDPKTRLPLVIEHTIKTGGKELTMTMSDFEFDVPLDDSLFSLKPPAGYKVVEKPLEIATDEASLIQVLRLYAQSTGGTFPPKLDDWSDYDKQLDTERFKKPGAAADPEFVQLVQTMIRSMIFVMQHKDTLKYRPEGVRLGEADKLLLWYQPKESKTSRAIYGDLHAADVTSDQLPEKPAE